LFIYFFYKEIWPLIAKKIIPYHLSKNESERLSRVTELQAERVFHQTIEKERLEEIKKISSAVQSLSVSMVQINERQTAILENQRLILSRQESTFTVMTDAIADMRARTGTVVSKDQDKENEE
jgi:hypothetical protein